jgi:DtxR family Mn-dependent transcriptional regulator
MFPSSTVENYLKAIYQGTAGLEPKQRLLPMGQLAEALDVSPGTATTMVKTLAESGLVEYEPYTGVTLTSAGKKLAALVLRRHRLVELFLVNVMGLKWDEVHEDAEQLEHAVSDRLVDRMDEMLGRPATDPHGDPIPDSKGSLKPQKTQSLLTCPLDTEVKVVRVVDQDKLFLRFLEQHDLKPGQSIQVEARDGAADSVRLRSKNHQTVTIGTRAASKLLVQAAQALILLAMLALPATAQPAPKGNNTTQPFEILDNSFFVEEAFNQEAGIFQNIIGVNFQNRKEWETTFTQEWPLLGWRHQLSYTVPYSTTGLGQGVGDLQLHYRLQVMPETATLPAFSPRLTLILPSGSASKKLGGAAGWQLNLPFSKQLGNSYLHWNAGFTHIPSEDNKTLTPHLALSTVWRASPMFQPMLEAVIEFEDAQVEGTNWTTVWTLAPGFRTGWNLGNTQTILGFSVPVIITKNQVSVGAFGYFSYELPFNTKP